MAQPETIARGTPPKIVAENVSVTFEVQGATKQILQNLDFSQQSGEFIAIVGPSGCGKTTFLNAVAGLVPISGGTLTLDGKPIAGPGPDRAMVFQEDALFPWKTVLGNATFGLKMLRKYSGQELKRKGEELIQLVGLGGFGAHYPHQLSGGMRQRVNLARALATDPETLLLDEPFAALDALTREVMQLELLKTWERTRKTALFITHQINEAVYLADRVVVFSKRPGSAKQVIPVPIPRPRPLAIKRDPEFLRLENAIWEVLEDEVRAVI